MDAGKPQIGALSGQPANIQLAFAVAEGHERLAPPMLQGLGSEWSVTTEDVLLHRERKVISPRRATGSVWVIAMAIGAAFGVAFLGWAVRQEKPPASGVKPPLQAIDNAELSRPAAPRSGTGSTPNKGTTEPFTGLASILIEPSRMASALSPMRTPANVPLRDPGVKAPDPIMVPSKRSNASLAFSFLGTQSLAAAVSASAGGSGYVLAGAAEQKLDPEALIARGDEFMRYSDVASARLFYKLAAANGSAAGAIAMGSTFDPIFLERGGVRGVRPEPKTALSWYRVAAELGDDAGKARSAQLLDMLRRDAARGDPQAKAILESSTP